IDLVSSLNFPHLIDEAPNGRDRFVKQGLLCPVQRNLDHPLHAASADDNRHADIETFDPVLAVEIGGTGQHALLVLEMALVHLDRRGCRGVVCGPRFQKADDLRAAVAHALDDLVEPFLRGPTHLHQVGKWNPGHGGIAYQGNHGIAMASENKCADVLDRDFELLGEKIAKASAVENARHADDAIVRQARGFAHQGDHRIERIGDDNDEGLRAMLLDGSADSGDDLAVDAQQIVTTHARLARNAGSADDNIRSCERGVVVRSNKLRIEAFDRRALCNIETLALWNAFDDINQHDVTEFLQTDEQRQRASDISGAYQGDLVASHPAPVRVSNPDTRYCVITLFVPQ